MVRRFCGQNHTECPILDKSRIPSPPPPPQLEHLDDLWTLVLSLPRISPPPQPTPELELLLEDFGTLVLGYQESHFFLADFGPLVLGLPRINPPPPPAFELLLEDSKGDWCEETNRCIPSEYCLVAISVVHRFLSVWDTDVYYTHAYIPKVYVNIVHIRGLGLPSKLFHLIAMHQM